MNKIVTLLSLVTILGLGACVVEQDQGPSGPSENDTQGPSGPSVNDTVHDWPVLGSVMHADDKLTISWGEGSNPSRPLYYRAQILETGDTCQGVRQANGALTCDIPLPSPAEETRYLYEVVGRYGDDRYGKPKRDSITLYPQPTWTSRHSATTHSLHSVVWTGSLLVAVGDSGVAMTSPDGTTWTVQATGTKRNLRGLAWHAGRYVAVGDSGTIISSQDAVAWSPRNSGTNHRLRTVAGGAGKFVAAGDRGTILASNGDTLWSVQQISNENLNRVLWADQNFVVVGKNTWLTSTDGADWVAYPEVTYWIPPITFFDLTWNNGKLMGVGSWERCTSDPKVCGGAPYYPYGYSKLSSRTDTLASGGGHLLYGVKADLTSVAWNGNVYLAGGGGYQAISSDGFWWTTRSGVPDLKAVVWTGTRWVGVGSGGVHTSP